MRPSLETASRPDSSAAPVPFKISPADYAFLQQHIYRESGIVIDETKEYLLTARLMPIVHRQSLQTISDLCALLRATGVPALKQQVVEAMTTNETQFFRDSGPFEALRSQLLPPMLARKSGRKFRFWSAAASSGQEAYSLAMLLLELGLTGADFEILATDLAESILDRARAGRYMQIEVNRGLPAHYLVKYFERHGLEWQLKDEVRRMVRFEQFDLRESMRTKGPFDVIFCRNVLIYFDVETKKKILSEIRGALFPGGYLLLGGSETTLNLDERFSRVTYGRTVLYQAP
jgi:chemotaxis protein methyltransferase CheR